MMYALSLNSSPLLVKHSLAFPLMLKMHMMLDLTLLLTDSGEVDLNAHFSMYERLIPMHPQIGLPTATESMNLRRSENTNSV